MTIINAWSTSDAPIYTEASCFSEVSIDNIQLFVTCSHLRAIHAYAIGY